MKKFTILIAIVSVFFYGCQSGGSQGEKITDQEGQYFIEGTFENLPENSKVYLDDIVGRTATTLDTATVDANGHFLMTGPFTQNILARLRIESNGIILIVEDEPMNIKGNYSDIKSFAYSIEGNERSEKVRQMYANSPKGGPGQKAYFKNYYETNKNDPFAAYWGLNFMKYQEEPKLWDDFAQRLNSKYPNHKFSKQVGNFVGQQKQQSKSQGGFAMGTPAPEIKLKNPKGEEMALSDYKGQVVLLDFWASWCRPCRAVNPQVVAMYNKYKNKGFTVFSVSLDKNLQKWEKAIQQDNLTWDGHVSDLGGWGSAAAALYGVRSIPTTFLVDKEGKIVGKNIKGSQLEAKLKELL